MPCESELGSAPRLDFLSEASTRVLSEVDLSHELALICRHAARAGGQYLRQARKRVGSTELKADHHDPVTEFDRALETSLAAILGDFVPGSAMLGEEHGVQVLAGGEAVVADGIVLPSMRPHIDVRSLAGRVRWVVDPIDGTSNFAAGDEYFGTSVAAQLDGVTVAGAVHIPCHERTVWANADAGWLETPEGFFRLDSRGPREESQATIYTYFPTSKDVATFDTVAFSSFSRILQAFRAIRRPGACALDLALLACGHVGAVFATQIKPWDVVAGAHLVRVSGGQVHHSQAAGEPFQTGGVGPAVLARAAGLPVPTLEGVWDDLGLVPYFTAPDGV